MPSKKTPRRTAVELVDLISISELKKRMQGISDDTLRRFVAKGPHRKIGRQYFVTLGRAWEIQNGINCLSE